VNWTGLATFLERTVRGALHRGGSAALFRHADRYRNEGRYEEAARLVALGLQQDPDSSVGHLLSAYLHVAARHTDPAKTDFQRVLALDPYHPRALLGLAKIRLEEQDVEGSKALLDLALQYYANFAEAQALREMVVSWPQAPTPTTDAARSAPLAEPGTLSERDVVMMRTDGTTLLARADGERGGQLSQHAIQVFRMASAAVSRAGLGSLRRGAVDTGSHTTFLLSDADLVFSATLDGHVGTGEGFAHMGRLKSELGTKAPSHP
jgi:tetratricopeptide (TPR) repeat protein